MADTQLVVRVAANLSELKTNLAEGVSQIETYKGALTRAASAFDGSRIITSANAAAAAIQNAGGVTSLTSSEMAKANLIFSDAAAKLNLMGQGGTYAAQQFTQLAAATKQTNVEAASSVQEFAVGIPIIGQFLAAMSVERVFEFAAGLVENAARIEDFARAMGATSTEVQKFSYVGVEFGIDVDQMARGVEQLSAKLANGDTNAVKAVEMLGLSVKDLLALGPTEAFLAVAEATGRVQDPMMKGALAADEFGGKLAKVLIPALADLRQKMNDVPQGAIISEQNVVTAHELDVAWDHLKTTWSTVFTDLIVRTAEAFGANTAAMREHAKATDAAAASTQLFVGPLQQTLTNAQLLTNRLTALRTDAVMPLTDAQKGAIVELESYGVSQKEIADLLGTSTIAVKKYTDALTEQGKAVKAAAEEERKRMQIEAEGILQVSKLWDEFDQLASKGGSTFDDQVAAIDRWALDLEAKAQKAGTDTKEFYDALTALWNAKLHEASQNAQAAMQKTADSSIQSFDAMNSAVMGIATSFAGWNAQIMAVDDSLKKVAADQASLDKGNTLDIGHAAQDPIIMELLHEGWSLANAEAIKLAQQWNFTPKLFSPTGAPETTPSPGERVPGYKDGGPTKAGLSILHDDEYVVPKGGALISSGGHSVNIAAGAVVINYPIMRDARAVAELTDVLSAGLLKKLVGMGFRSTSGI